MHCTQKILWIFSMKVNQQGFIVICQEDAYSLNIDSFSVKDLGLIRILSDKHNLKYNFLGSILYKSRKKRIDANVGSRVITKDDYCCDGSPELKRLPLIKNILEAFLNKELSHGSLYNILGFIEWVDFSYPKNLDFNDINSKRECYKYYTNYLLEKRSHSNVRRRRGYSNESITFSNARNKQQAALLTIVYSTSSLTKDIVKTWEIELKQSPSEKAFSFSLNVKKALNTRDYHLHVFTSIYEHIISSNQNALKLQENKTIGLREFVVASNLVRDLYGKKYKNKTGIDTYKLVFCKNGKLRFNNLEEAKKEIEKMIGKSIIYSTYYKSIKLYSKIMNEEYMTSNNNYGNFLFDIAIKSFCHIFLLDTGCNCESLRYLSLKSTKQLKKFGTKRILSYKNRIGEKVIIYMTSKMVKYWNMMIEINKWKFGSIEDLFGIRISNKSLITHRIISRRSGWYNDIFPDDALWVNAKEWRDYSTYITLSTTDDITFSALRHNHTVSTARKHYVKIDNAQALKSNHLFFKEMAKKVRLYKDNNIISIMMLDDKKSYKGKTGRCTGDLPKALDGLDIDAKEPKCTTQIHCFFCKSYGLHASVDDIVMLLSIKKWLPIHGKFTSENADEYMVKYFPIIQRIDDILTDFSNRNNKYKDILELAMVKIKNGNLTPYWQAKINALNALEISQ